MSLYKPPNTTHKSETAHMNLKLCGHCAEINKIDQAIYVSEKSYNENNILLDLDMIFNRLNKKYYGEI